MGNPFDLRALLQSIRLAAPGHEGGSEVNRAKIDPTGPLLRHPLQPHQLADRVTPTGNAIVLCHLGVPRLATEDWSLTIDGLVRKPLRLTLEELMQRPRTEITSVHQCCGSPLQPEVPTRRVCNVVWRGVRLSDLIDDCQPEPTARFVWSSGADHGEFQGVSCEAYVKDLPIERVAADVMIAFDMNGLPLLPEHGFPARLVVPGYYGTNSVKWLCRLTLADTRATSPFTTRWYNDPVRPASGQRTGLSSPVWSVAPECVIVAPAPNQNMPVGEPLEIWGWAWADEDVTRVNVSTNGGVDWMRAAIEPRTDRAWQRFTAMWRPERRGSHELCSQARSADGRCQPPSGARNAIHRVSIQVV